MDACFSVDVCFCCHREVGDLGESFMCADCTSAIHRLDSASDVDLEAQKMTDEEVEEKVVWSARLFVKRLRALRKGKPDPA